MKKNIVVLLALSLLILLAVAAPVHARPDNVYTAKHQIGMANWTMFDGETTTEVFISACMQHASLYISIYQYGPDVFTPLLDASGEIPDTAFSIDKKLTTATLTGTFTVYDWISMGELDVTINIEWTSIGSRMKYSDNWRSKSEYSIENGHMRDVSKDAVAVGSTSIIDISEPVWTFAQLSSSKQHSVVKYSDDFL
jgi:hypothetical protein